VNFFNTAPTFTKLSRKTGQHHAIFAHKESEAILSPNVNVKVKSNDMKNLNHYSLRLTDYIIHNHPDRIMDKEFIEDRGQRAVEVFAECSRQGMSFEDANYEATRTLYHGLHFSPVKMIDEILDTDFPEMNLMSIHRGSLLMQILAFVKPVIEKYHNENNDAVFQGSTAYPKARLHVKRMINQFVYDNGLQ